MKTKPPYGKLVCLEVALMIFGLPLLAQPYWPQFRGPNGLGVSTSGNPPVQFGPAQNVRWKFEVPAGHSSPCVWGDRVYLTGVEGRSLITLSIDRANGTVAWRKQVEVEQLEEHHATSSPVTATPTADAERVYGYFGSFGLIAYARDGQEVWRHPMPIPKNKYGAASSPILYGKALIQLVDTDAGDSRILALDRKTGEELWTHARSDFSAGWSTPLIWSHEGQDELIALGKGRLIAYDPNTGSERWWVDGFPQETVNSPTMGDGLLFASSAALGGRGNEKLDPNYWSEMLKMDQNGDGKLELSEIPDDYRMVLRPELPADNPGRAFPGSFKQMFKSIDKDNDGYLTEEEMKARMAAFETFTKPVLMAIRPGGRDDAKSQVAWEIRRGIPEIPSPLYFEGAIYMVRDGGLLTCLNPKDGVVRYQERLGVGGQYSASPVAAAGRIYAAAQSGTVIVFKPGEKAPEVLARNDLRETMMATPAFAGNAILVRTAKHLYAFEQK